MGAANLRTQGAGAPQMKKARAGETARALRVESSQGLAI
jgi:hypothetical protein